jgi:transposase
VSTYESLTADLHRMADWLVALGITTVAMESTGVYWSPAFEMLEARGLEVLLVHARLVKNVPGRKTDGPDAVWLQQVPQQGRLRGSFRPAQTVATLRAYLRHRARLLAYAAAHMQHRHKALMQMHVQLHHVVSDITGATGMKIVRAIVAGTYDPAVLAAYRDMRCNASVKTIQEACTGHYRAEHVCALRPALALYDSDQEKVAECDQAIEAVLAACEQTTSERVLPAARYRTRQANEPRFDVRTALFQLLGTDLTQLHGCGAYTALRRIGECGTAMSKWPTAQHVTSWLTVAPDNKISGGKLLRTTTRRSANRAAKILRLAAVNVGQTQTAFGAFSRRLAARGGQAKAVTATARKLAVLFDNALRYGMAYKDPGATYDEAQYRERVLKGLRRRAQELGYALQELAPVEGVS